MTEPSSTDRKLRQATRLVRGGTNRSQFGETSEGLFMTSGYIYDSAEQAQGAFTGDEDRFVYSRYANPTVASFEARMALLEGAEQCKATASGMAAVYGALMASVRAGQRVVASRALFGSCSYIIGELLPRFGVEAHFVDGRDLDQWRVALAEPTAAVFLETPSNPTLEIIDLPAVAELAHKAGARVVVDNVFATPLYQKPLALGADVVVYSATKHVDGQGRSLGGAILSNDTEWMEGDLSNFLRHTGPALSPFNAWILLKGLETLELRVERQTSNAAKIADFLAGQSAVTQVFYPGRSDHPQHELAKSQMSGFGTIVTFNMADGATCSARDAAFALVNGLNTIDISNNLGDSKSLITHPATTTHQRLSDDERSILGIGPGTLRLSVGLEDVRDLIYDLRNAIEAAI